MRASTNVVAAPSRAARGPVLAGDRRAPPTGRPPRTSSSRCTVRSAMRRTLSISPSRSIAGIAHSSPIVSAVTSWNAATNSSTFSRSMRPSVCADQRDRDLVDARIARQRPARELGQLAVVAAAAGSRAPRGCAPARRGSCRAATRRPAPRRSRRRTPREAACRTRPRPAGSRRVGSAAASAASPRSKGRTT